jgi:hypothetical protein
VGCMLTSCFHINHSCVVDNMVRVSVIQLLPIVLDVHRAPHLALFTEVRV